ncbi:TRAP transporter large permease [Microbaculum sp. FT89]|uniref:TRAP transporter large permease n=1 Tax=Microbaculum sp. FT89 TaxID=3447298 RepID=UPI003F534D9D
MTEMLPLVMIGLLIVFIFLGFPVAFVLGGVGIGVGLLAGLPLGFFNIVVSRIYVNVMMNWLLLAIPLFIFMGLVLERSGIVRTLLLSSARMMGRFPGNIALSVVIIGVIFAAATGVIGASVVLLGIIALPAMHAAGYRQELAAGVVMASSTLGILIPPSIMLVLIGDQMQVSVGKLFAGAIMPGLVIAGLMFVTILSYCFLRPQAAPAYVDKDWEELSFLTQLRGFVEPLVLITIVLGSILAGIATPTEAAAIGAAGAMVLAAMHGGLNRRILGEATRSTVTTTAMVLWLMVGATCFSLVFTRLGGNDLVASATDAMGLGPYGTMIAVLALVFVLGFFLEWIEITYIVVPIFLPVIVGLDFGAGVEPQDIALWFGVLLAVCLQTSFLTPPFGFALFYLKGIAKQTISVKNIYKGAIPFVLIQLIALTATILFPGIILWLPSLM